MLSFGTHVYIQADSQDHASAMVAVMEAALLEAGHHRQVLFDVLIQHETPEHEKTIVYTDGGCDAQRHGVGAWAFVAFVPGQPPMRIAQHDIGVTNNLMEMQAVIEALSVLEMGTEIVIHCDSEYVIKGTTVWSRNWRRNGWQTANGAPVKNKEKWVELIDLFEAHNATFVHVKGHSGVEGNEWCDAACTAAMSAKFEELAAQATETP